MEKIKLANGNEYEIIPGGFQRNSIGDGVEQLRLIFADRENLSFDSVEADFQSEENTNNISYIGITESVEDVISGYTILKSVEKCNNYLIGHDTKQLDADSYQMDEIRGTVYVILLAKPDFQTQFENLKETVDMMVLSALEV